MITECPLCDGRIQRVRQMSDKDSVVITCSRCGEFQMPGGKFNIKDELRPLLSVYTRTHSAQGEKPILASSTIEALAKEVESIPVETKTTSILEYLMRKSRFMGDWVAIHLDSDWPLFHSRNPDELLFLLERLRRENLVEPKQFPFDTKPNCRLTVQAWQLTSKEKVASNRRAPDIDVVTKIRSRKQMESDLPTLFSESKAGPLPLALLVIDLDYFKKQ